MRGTAQPVSQFQIAVDIGGTFTDGVLLAEASGEVFVAKALTTPDDPGEAVSTVVRALLDQMPQASVRRVAHGTTLVANTLVERRGVRAALVLTTGTRDCLDIRRELRYDIYDLAAIYPRALIPACDRFELGARIGPAGQEWTTLDASALADLAGRLSDDGYQAIAVCLLHAPVDERHEQMVADVLRAAMPSVPVSVSSDVAREIGEYERMSTVAANAYVQPIVARYLSELRDRLDGLGVDGTLDVMLSNGAFTRADLAARAPIRILESGPAGGVLSAVNCAAIEDTHRVLAFDMGGTTAKACVAVDGKPALTHVFEFGRVQRFKRGSGLPAVAPSIDLIEIGAGGGSLATLNALGLMQVGPQSAGSEPGPACYGRGGRDATVTDADLTLGYLDAQSFLGGRMPLDLARAHEALARAGERLGLDVQATAWGVHDIVNENMASAARTHIAEKGFDAREFTMVATGGAGPVHAVDVARRLRIRRVLCPIASGVGSCLGFLAAPARADRAWSRVEALNELDHHEVDARIARAREAISGDLAACGLGEAEIEWRLSAEVRYAGQGNTVEVMIGTPALTGIGADQITARFEKEYVRRYRKTVPGGEPEVVTWRLSGGSSSAPRAYRLADGAHALGSVGGGAVARRIFLPGSRSFESVPSYARSALPLGESLAAPLIITEPESTLVVAHPGTVQVLPSGTLEVLLEESA